MPIAIRLSFLLCLSICFAGQAQSGRELALPPPVQDVPDPPSIDAPKIASKTEWTVWKDDHFQILCPPNWYIGRPDDPNVIVTFLSQSMVSTIAAVYKIDIVFRGTATELGEQLIQFWKPEFPNAKLLSTKLTMIKSVEAVELSYANVAGEGTRSRRVLFSTGQAVYVVDLLYDVSRADECEKLFTRMIKTIDIF